MNRLWLWIVVVLVPAGIVAASVWPVQTSPGAAGVANEGVAAATAARTVGQPLGMAGCTAAACHGASAEEMLATGPTGDVWRCAATFWLAADPHTQAYAALESDLARDIMARLKGPHTDATQDLRCLACHTNPSLAKETPFASLRAEGVGCEACHGNSSGWLHGHTTWTARESAEGYEQTGMAKLYDLGERAMVCAGCHVGAPAGFPVEDYLVRDMNHDMIAAGHPRLNFDFADYQHRLPPHWVEKDRDPDFEVKAWLIGRVAHAEAACRLLEDRAKRAEANEERTPWPEFAEYQCVSCHHSLGKSYPPPQQADTRRPGSPRWQEIWPVDSIMTVDASLFSLGGRASGPIAPALRLSMEKPHPRLRDAALAAAGSAQHLRQVGGRLMSNRKELEDTAAALFKAAGTENLDRIDRDFAEQLYHGLAARERARLARAAQAGQSAQPPEAFESLRKHLLVERGNLSFRIPERARADLKELLK